MYYTIKRRKAQYIKPTISDLIEGRECALYSMELCCFNLNFPFGCRLVSRKNLCFSVRFIDNYDLVCYNLNVYNG